MCLAKKKATNSRIWLRRSTSTGKIWRRRQKSVDKRKPTTSPLTRILLKPFWRSNKPSRYSRPRPQQWNPSRFYRKPCHQALLQGSYCGAADVHPLSLNSVEPQESGIKKKTKKKPTRKRLEMKSRGGQRFFSKNTQERTEAQPLPVPPSSHPSHYLRLRDPNVGRDRHAGKFGRQVLC